MPGTVNGWTVAYTAVGGLVLWSGIAGTGLSATVKGALSGQSPSQLPSTETIAAAAPAAAASPAGSAAPGNTGAASSGAAANQAIAKILAAPYGWSTGTQWSDLVSLWNQESGWSATAQNPTSTAYGIAQFLDTTWASTGFTKTSSASGQIAAGLAYIKERYGSPEAAWAHEVAEGWY